MLGWVVEVVVRVCGDGSGDTERGGVAGAGWLWWWKGCDDRLQVKVQKDD